MVRHDPHGHNGEPDPPGAPGLRALGAMAAAAQRAREVQEGGPPTRAVEIRFDDEPVPNRPPGPDSSQAPAQPVAPPATSRRSPLEIAVWVAAALLLVAAGALAVTLGRAGQWRQRAGRPTLDRGAHRCARHPARPGQRAERPRIDVVRAARARAPRPRPPRRAPPNASGPPVIAALNPSSGTAGQAIQVAGANFLSSSGQITATFDGQVAPTSCPAQNTCSVTVPPAPSGTQISAGRDHDRQRDVEHHDVHLQLEPRPASASRR